MSFKSSFKNGALLGLVLGGSLLIANRCTQCSMQDESRDQFSGKFRGYKAYASKGPIGIGRRVTIYFNRTFSNMAHIDAIDADSNGTFERVRYVVPQEKVADFKIEYNDAVLNEIWNNLTKEKN